MKASHFLLLIFCLLGANLMAQYEPGDSTEKRPFAIIETIEGDEFEGYLIYQDTKIITIEDRNGHQITIKVEQIKELSFEQETFSKAVHYNLQASRYFFGPNALNMKRGEGYYQNNWVFLNQLSVGLSDRFTIGVGTIPLFIFGYGAPTPVWITPKFSVPIVPGKLNVAAGGLFGSVLGDEFNNTFGIGYGAFTLGDYDKNVTLSIGYGMSDGDWSENPTISLSGMLRVTRKFYLITENYLVFDTFIASLGGRTVWREVSLDYGFFTLPDEIDALIPWLGITVPFDLKKE
ncbi:hypothetical protein [Croceimicrobium hydrocarbonivorans]|uniref:Uncharacterized protein n=1 Tax=Croceimicrobium hydrocarbonivorans TaxID=2761580 RepID=A0A7H0VGK7_9FLAO|nr:hypothetical protein [Croceimicrobium hydrocarbonivorans]QNR24855.1 hypothetical protein H4K34_03160 [Croceimicrobium hydrocarbonivorans]